MKWAADLFKNLGLRQKQSLVYYSCIRGVAAVVSVVIWNVVFAGSSLGTTSRSAPTQKILTGASRLDPQNAWNERMTNHFALQEKEIADLKRLILQLNETLHSKAPQDGGLVSAKKDTQNTAPSSSSPNKGTNPSLEGTDAPMSEPGVVDMSFPDQNIAAGGGYEWPPRAGQHKDAC